MATRSHPSLGQIFSGDLLARNPATPLMGLLSRGAGLNRQLAGSEAALDLELADQPEQKGQLGCAIDLFAQNRQKTVSYYA